MSEHLIEVTNYYDNFKCKCGNCRNSCCKGWGVTITYKEYCMLIGINCKKELRKKIDCGFSILDNPTSERYAEINHNWLGECHLQNENGLCLIHKILGEKYLPLICRMYPRNFSINVLHEGAVSNSCEKTLELLFSDSQKISLVNRKIDFEYSPILENTTEKDIETYKKIQSQSISLLSERKYTLKHRFTNLSRFIDEIFNCHLNQEKIEQVLQSHKNLEIDYADYAEIDMEKTLHIIMSLSKTICDISPNFKQYALIAKNNYQKISSDDALKSYQYAKEKFIELHNNWEICLEKLIINHMLFQMFPVSVENGNNILKEYMSLCGVYALTKFIVTGFSLTAKNDEEIIDNIAKLYKFFEHFNADNLIVSNLENLGINNLNQLIYITDI